MTQHFTRNTVSAQFWCGKCQKTTSHRIDGGRKGPCIECVARLELHYSNKPTPAIEPERQACLFGDAS